MPRNETIERVAMQCRWEDFVESDHRPIEKDMKQAWHDLSTEEQEGYRQEALRLLAIVQSRTYGATDDAGGEIVACEEDLADALYLALRAREKGGVDAKEENDQETD